ncbi:hypothetical protein CK500_02625 [Halorubrum salipaludis]|uniref:Glycosyltransferase RgtA/B/C/D-like domain-containing protein n=1 Tax=Halorubrum salipaludis TaxID=2032630 RepID=A0A2A2FJH3_9EURY|nr:hypothetical protein CK500_02625 [Halorubrum salipaludis]
MLRAGFSLVGAVVALALFVASRETASDGERALDPGRRLSPALVTKAVVALSCGAVVAAARLNSRLVPLAVLLPIGLFAVALQIRGDPSVPAVLTQLGALFAAARLGKYVTTGFYFGGTDTFAHVAAVDALIETGRTTAIPHGYDLYPVFHFVVGTVEHVTRLPSYDALVLAGVASMTLVVPIAYLLGWSVFGSTRLGLLAALSVTLLEFFSYHALYFYPQALASVLILVAVYVNSQLRQAADERTFRRLSVFVLALVATMVVTHHLTYILFAGVAAVAVPFALVRPSLFGRAKPAAAVGAFRYRWLFPGLVGAVLLLTYWAYSPSLITVGIVELTAGVLLDVATIPGGQLYTYGAPLPTDTVGRAVEWLLTPTGVYASGLTALALLAGYELLAEFRAYRRGFTLAATGLVLSPLLLPLPIPVPQLERLKFVVTLVVLFPLSVGLKRALSVDRRYVVVALVLVAALGGATAFTVLAADDMSETYIDEPREQVTMTDGEYGSVGTTAAFLREYGDGPTATDRVTNRAFETASFNATRQLRARQPGLRADATYLVVRERWTDHVVALGDGLRSGELNTFTVSQARFDRADSTRDKVYTTARVRVYRSDDGFEGVYGNGTDR